MEQLVDRYAIAKQWWRARRLHYNRGLVIVGASAFLLYVVLGSLLLVPYDVEFEITLFTIAFQGIGYLFMMGIANLFYNLGYFIDKHYNTDNSEKFRTGLYKKGYWFSFCLPFLIPIMVVIVYFVEYAGKPLPIIVP